MFGTADAAAQAQAARDQAGRGGLLSRGEQKPADEGLFAPKDRGRRAVLAAAARTCGGGARRPG